MFEFYDIVSIENKGSGAQDFNFDPGKLFANGDINGNTISSSAGASFTNLLTGNAGPKLVPKGTTSGPLGRIVIAVPTDNPNGEKTAQTTLLYKSASGESVLLVRDAGPQPKFLDPCTPATVQRLALKARISRPASASCAAARSPAAIPSRPIRASLRHRRRRR